MLQLQSSKDSWDISPYRSIKLSVFFVLMPFMVLSRLLAVRLFSYNLSSYLSLRDCKATMLCYKKGLG